MSKLMARWIVRICFCVVFAWNIQCAFSFIVAPEAFMGGFQLSGIEGVVALRGLGIAFLMWNATYPLFIWQPERFRVLGFVILIQQLIGAVGETIIFCTLPSEALLLQHSITRFMLFDFAGLVIMGISYLLLFCAPNSKRTNLGGTPEGQEAAESLD